MDNSFDLLKNHRFRVIVTRGLDGPQNMAADEALLARGREGEVVLRFYDWAIPTLSLGYFQKISSRQLETYRQRGISLVRRPTGGRAVFHDDEITYSVTLPLKREATRSWSAPYYAAISQFLLWGLERLGVKGAGQARPGRVRQDRRNREIKSTTWCFAIDPALGGTEISVDGRKLVGSAQRLYAHGLLQHGSIIRRIASSPESLDFWPRGEDGRGLATSLEEVLGRKPGFMEVVTVYTEILKQRSVPWEFSALKPETGDLIAALAREKYERLDWPRVKGPAASSSPAPVG